MSDLPKLPITIPLSSPIKNFGNVSEVKIEREPNGHDAIAIDGLGEKAAAIKLIERLCGLTPEAALSLSWRDITAIEQAIAPFVS